MLRRELEPTAMSLFVSYKRWFGAMPFEVQVNATVARYWYRKKMQINKMLWKTKRSFRS